MNPRGDERASATGTSQTQRRDNTFPKLITPGKSETLCGRISISFSFQVQEQGNLRDTRKNRGRNWEVPNKPNLLLLHHLVVNNQLDEPNGTETIRGEGANPLGTEPKINSNFLSNRQTRCQRKEASNMVTAVAAGPQRFLLGGTRSRLAVVDQNGDRRVK